MFKLNETSVSSDGVCPYCGYKAALYEESNKPEYKPKNWNKVGGFCTWSYCPLCGWQEWENYEGDIEPINWDPLEDEPSNQQIDSGKRINKVYNFITDNDLEELSEAFQDYIWDKYNNLEDDYNDFKKGFMKYLFKYA